jgi:hypothetical protein
VNAFDGAPPGQSPLTQFDVQVVRRDGTGRRTLTSSEDREIDAQWSPDGTRISYSRLRKADEDDWRKTWIWTMRPDGRDQRPLVQGSNARWSPDGKQLAFSAPTARSFGDLFVINADGSGLRRLLATPRLEWPNAWSPNGRTILFTRSLRRRAFRRLRDRRRRHECAQADARAARERGRHVVARRDEDRLHQHALRPLAPLRHACEQHARARAHPRGRERLRPSLALTRGGPGAMARYAVTTIEEDVARRPAAPE